MADRYLGLGLMVALVAGCGADAPSFARGEVEFRAPPGSGQPNLHVTTDGRAILTWFERAGNGKHALKVAVRDAGTWSQAKTIVEGDSFFVNWADFPSLVELADGSWMVHWLAKVAPRTYAYHVEIAISNDRGTSWSDPIVPHRDDSPTEHGFVSLVPMEDGGAAAVWLDGRGMNGDEEGSEGEGALGGQMSVRATTIGSDGTLGPDVLLDERTCECCQTALARTSRGLVAAYRDRSQTEIRDIAVVRLVDGEWTEPVHVHDDNWRYPGCPVNGPQLSAAGDAVAVAWFTAPEQKRAVYAAFSVDAGASFDEPIRVDDGDPLGRVDIELLENGDALVVWLERTADAAEVRARVVGPGGVVGSSLLVAATSEAGSSGFPRMVRAGEEVLFAWIEPGASGGVRVITWRESE